MVLGDSEPCGHLGKGFDAENVGRASAFAIELFDVGMAGPAPGVWNVGTNISIGTARTVDDHDIGFGSMLAEPFHARQ